MTDYDSREEIEKEIEEGTCPFDTYEEYLEAIERDKEDFPEDYDEDGNFIS